VPDLGKNSRLKVPRIELHRDGDDFIVEIDHPFTEVIKCRLLSTEGGQALGWSTVDASRSVLGAVDSPRFFWPCSSPYNFAHYLSMRAVIKHRSMARWKQGFMTGLIAAKMLKLIRPSVAKMDPRAPLVCRKIPKHISFYDWKMRCYERTCAIAIMSHLDHGIPLRPALILSDAMKISSGKPVWSISRGCAEDHPLHALEYQHGDAGHAIYDSIVRSKRQLHTVDIGSRLINEWSFATCPSGQPSAEAMAFAYVSGMHACKCCIGDDAESFCRKVGELVSETPRKGRRGKLNHVDVCIGNCKSSNCGKVEDEPIL